MARSATESMHDIINAAVVDAIVALKDASKGLPNALLRDLNAVHANTAYADLPDAVRTAITASIRDAFAKLRKDGYVVAEVNSIQSAPVRQEPRAARPHPTAGKRPPASGPPGKGRPRPGR
jgi:hypothetical protein